METETIRFSELWNEEAFQFITEVMRLIEQHTVVKTKIDTEYQTFIKLRREMDDLLEVIRKSYITEEIVAADTERDNTYNTFRAIVKASVSHFDETRKKAACKLRIVFEHFGDLAKEGYNQETASLYNFIQELNTKYANELTQLRMQEWVTKLDVDNKAFEALLSSRDKEISMLPKASMPELRYQIYESYKKMIAFVQASFLITSEAALIPFLNELNTIVTRYNNVVKRRKGKGKNNNDDDNDNE